MTSYLVTIEIGLKCARGINEQLLKTSGADVLPSTSESVVFYEAAKCPRVGVGEDFT